MVYGFNGTPSTGPVLTGNQTNNKGGGFEKVLTNSGTIIDTANRLLCTINPKRPGCQINETTIIQEQRRNTWVLVAMFALVIVLLIVLIRRKK